MLVTAGTLYAFVDYITRLFNPIVNIVNQFSQLERSLVAGSRVFELLDQYGEPVKENRVNRYDGNVTFHNVSFAYKDEDYVLKNLNFEAKKGRDRGTCRSHWFGKKFNYEFTVPFL